MPKFTRIEGYSELNGSSKQGQVSISYDALVRVFGEPSDGDGEKTTIEWRIRFEDGTIADVYDYWHDAWAYGGPPDRIEVSFNRLWKIGGFSPRATQLVLEALKAELDEENHVEWFRSELARMITKYPDRFRGRLH